MMVAYQKYAAASAAARITQTAAPIRSRLRGPAPPPWRGVAEVYRRAPRLPRSAWGLESGLVQPALLHRLWCTRERRLHHVANAADQRVRRERLLQQRQRL